MSLNRCDPEHWLADRSGGEHIWAYLERAAHLQGDVHAAALLALRSLLETHRTAGLDLYDRVERLERRTDRLVREQRQVDHNPSNTDTIAS